MRTFYRDCNKKATCNCAVAIRSGDDVILIDRCGQSAKIQRRKRMTIKIYKNGELTPGTRIRRFGGGKKYEVITKDVGILQLFIIDRILKN